MLGVHGDEERVQEESALDLLWGSHRGPAAGEGDEPGKATAEKQAARRFHNPKDLCRGLCPQRGVHPLR